jgi:hypothetical protein
VQRPEYVCVLYHTSSMMTTYMQISRVPACPGKLSDRQRETRKVGKEYLVLHTQSCPKAVAPHDRFRLSRWTDHRLDAVADLIFCPSIAVRPTLPLSIHLRYSISGVVRGIIIGSGRLEGRLCCQRINAIITAAPPSLCIRRNTTRRRGRDGY